MPTTRDLPIMLSAAAVLRRNGLRFGGRLHPRVRSLVPEMLEVIETEELLRPALAYTEWPVAGVTQTAMRLVNGACIEDAPRLAERLGSATSVLTAAGTLGPRLDAHISGLFADRQPMRALVLEEIGVLAVARLGDAIRNHLDAEIGVRSLECSSPMSPGENRIRPRRSADRRCAGRG